MRTRTKIVASILAVGAIVAAAAFLALGCLKTTDEDFDGELEGPGNLTLENFPNFIPIYPDDDDDDDTDNYDDDDDIDLGPYCEAVLICVCPKMDAKAYDQCIESAQSLPESKCQSIIDDYYPECSPYS